MALTGTAIIIVEWCNLTFTLLLVIFRQFLRFHFGNHFNLCDFFVILAWLFFLVQGSLDTALWRLGHFNGKIVHAATEFGPEHGLATYEDTVTALKIVYVETILYYSSMYCVKWSMLAFYESLIPRQMKKLRIAMWITVALTIIGYVSTFFVKLLLCLPMWANWTPGAQNCDPVNAEEGVLVRWVQHVVTDVLVYVLPLFLLKSLQLKRSQKIGIGATFVVGFICIFFACAENVSIWMLADYPTIWLFADLEQTWAIIVVCCPALRALLKYIERNRTEAMSGMSGSGSDGKGRFGGLSKSRGSRNNRSRSLSGGDFPSRMKGHALHRITLDEELGGLTFKSTGESPMANDGFKMEDSIMVTYEIDTSTQSAASAAGDDEEKNLVKGNEAKVTTVAFADQRK